MTFDDSTETSAVDKRPDQPVYLYPQNIDLLNDQKIDWEPLNIVNESRRARIQMPPGKSGIVLGSGPNTEFWKSVGWKTLDVEPSDEPDYVGDANWLEKIVPDQSQDYLYAEAIKMEPNGKDGAVGWGRLLNQSNLALKEGGVISVSTASFVGNPESTLPPLEWFSEIMVQHGFEVVVERSELTPYGEGKSYQQVIYHGRKIAPGYDTERLDRPDRKSM